MCLRDADGVNNVVKYLLFIFNFIFWLMGCVLIGVGAWAYIEKNRFYHNQIESIYDVLFDVGIGVIIIGCIIFVIAFAGCLGALRENICLLKFFCYVLGILFLCEIIGAILILVFSGQGKEEVTKIFREEGIIRYRDDPDFQSILDWVQETFKCCGVGYKGYRDWSLNPYFNCSETNYGAEKCAVPYSCCVNPNNIDTDLINRMCGYGVQKLEPIDAADKVYIKGCVQSIIDTAKQNLYIIGGIALAVAVPQIAGPLLGCYLISKIKRNTWKQRNNKKMYKYQPKSILKHEKDYSKRHFPVFRNVSWIPWIASTVSKSTFNHKSNKIRSVEIDRNNNFVPAVAINKNAVLELNVADLKAKNPEGIQIGGNRSILTAGPLPSASKAESGVLLGLGGTSISGPGCSLSVGSGAGPVTVGAAGPGPIGIDTRNVTNAVVSYNSLSDHIMPNNNHPSGVSQSIVNGIPRIEAGLLPPSRPSLQTPAPLEGLVTSTSGFSIPRAHTGPPRGVSSPVGLYPTLPTSPLMSPPPQTPLPQDGFNYPQKNLLGHILESDGDPNAMDFRAYQEPMEDYYYDYDMPPFMDGFSGEGMWAGQSDNVPYFGAHDMGQGFSHEGYAPYFDIPPVGNRFSGGIPEAEPLLGHQGMGQAFGSEAFDRLDFGIPSAMNRPSGDRIGPRGPDSGLFLGNHHRRQTFTREGFARPNFDPSVFNRPSGNNLRPRGPNGGPISRHYGMGHRLAARPNFNYSSAFTRASMDRIRPRGPVGGPHLGHYGMAQGSTSEGLSQHFPQNLHTIPERDERLRREERAGESEFMVFRSPPPEYRTVERPSRPPLHLPRARIRAPLHQRRFQSRPRNLHYRRPHMLNI